jgi:hypothetical protein
MAISYPLSLPTHTGFSNVELRAKNAVSYSRSPFTFAGQAFAYSGQMWQADITLPPMRRSDAEQWIAWLVSLRGQLGTFLLGDKISCEPRGTATSATISGSAGDNSVTVVMTGTLLAGDYLQLGSSESATLHKVLQDQDGNGTLEIWPAIRTNQSSAAATLSNAQGLFMLSTNEQSWSISNAAVYGISFSAMEEV